MRLEVHVIMFIVAAIYLCGVEIDDIPTANISLVSMVLFISNYSRIQIACAVESHAL